jgi:hypothetical protein
MGERRHQPRHCGVRDRRDPQLVEADFKTYINGQLALEHTLPEPVSGRIGLWSKTDSTSYFKDYVVESA